MLCHKQPGLVGHHRYGKQVPKSIDFDSKCPNTYVSIPGWGGMAAAQTGSRFVSFIANLFAITFVEQTVSRTHLRPDPPYLHHFWSFDRWGRAPSRSFVRACGNSQVEMPFKCHAPPFPFSLLVWGSCSFPFGSPSPTCCNLYPASRGFITRYSRFQGCQTLSFGPALVPRDWDPKICCDQAKVWVGSRIQNLQDGVRKNVDLFARSAVYDSILNTILCFYIWYFHRLWSLGL